MADETLTSGNDEVESTDAGARTTKKQRAPRRSKVTPEVKVAAEPSRVETVAKERKQRGGKAAQSAVVTRKEPVGAKTRSAVAKPVKAAANTPGSAMDEMAELLQLEEENKRLRRTLADKLRAENADLRKRLGLA
jgi:putative transposase